MSSNNYKYAARLLEQFNRTVEADEVLRNLFCYKGWNVLQAYQASLFSDMKVWSKDRRFEALRSSFSFFRGLKIIAIGSFMVIETFLACVWVIISRKKILVFSGDKIDGSHYNDFRLNTLYQVLHEGGVPYIEIIHTLSNRNTLTNFFVRKRLVMYQEAVDFLLWPYLIFHRRFALSAVKGVKWFGECKEDDAFLNAELAKYLEALPITKIRLVWWKIFFRFSKIKQVVSIDDPRHYNEIMAAARERNIFSYGIQHGHFTKYHMGWLKKTKLPGNIMRPGRLLVWSEYWKGELLKLGTYFVSDEIIIAGEREIIQSVEVSQIQKIGILIPYEKDVPKEDVRKYIEEFLKIPSLHVMFKLRIDESEASQLEEYGINNIVDKITTVRSITDILPEVHVVAGTYSTFLYDCVAYERPVIILKSSIDYGEGMVTNGLATLLKLTDDIEGTVRSVALIPIEELKRRSCRLKAPAGVTLEKTLRFIIDSHATKA